MIYEFEIKETSRAIVPVRADSLGEAHKIFNEWYDKHNENPVDETIDELLANGYDGRAIFIIRTDKEDNYPIQNIMLPEEKSQPEVAKCSIQIRFADQDYIWKFENLSPEDWANKVLELSNDYYLMNDPEYDSQSIKCSYFYAVPRNPLVLKGGLE